MDKENLKNDFLKELDGYFMQLSYLHDLDAVDKDILKHNKEMERAPTFKLIIECALMNDYMITFMRLYDKDKNAKTIKKLIEKTNCNIHLFPNSKHDCIKKKLSEFENTMNTNANISHAIEVLEMRRDKILAHNDSKYFGIKQINDTSYLPMHQLWELFFFTKEVLFYIFSLLSDNATEPIQYKPQYNEDLSKLFE